jgi:redox-sensitive bicupin YhaK (pirin superfamily)
MIRHIPFESLYFADHGWLQSRFHFSFAEYRNAENISYGPLRVMNDDIIKAHEGFGTHPHHDMEIITYILKGELTHQDSMGHKESLGRGAIQYMSAGRGVTHSELNEGEEDVHLIQTWILPSEKGLQPQYGSKVFSPDQRHNRWLHLVGPKNSGSEITIYQDASMYVCELDAEETIDFHLQQGRSLYVKIMEGSANINGMFCQSGDAVEISEEDLNADAIDRVHILLIEVDEQFSLH